LPLNKPRAALEKAAERRPERRRFFSFLIVNEETLFLDWLASAWLELIARFDGSYEGGRCTLLVTSFARARAVRRALVD
jgi:hypothetical protein